MVEGDSCVRSLGRSLEKSRGKDSRTKEVAGAGESAQKKWGK